MLRNQTTESKSLINYDQYVPLLHLLNIPGTIAFASRYLLRNEVHVTTDIKKLLVLNFITKVEGNRYRTSNKGLEIVKQFHVKEQLVKEQKEQTLWQMEIQSVLDACRPHWEELEQKLNNKEKENNDHENGKHEKHDQVSTTTKHGLGIQVRTEDGNLINLDEDKADPDPIKAFEFAKGLGKNLMKLSIYQGDNFLTDPMYKRYRFRPKVKQERWSESTEHKLDQLNPEYAQTSLKNSQVFWIDQAIMYHQVLILNPTVQILQYFLLTFELKFLTKPVIQRVIQLRSDTDSDFAELLEIARNLDMIKSIDTEAQLRQRLAQLCTNAS